MAIPPLVMLGITVGGMALQFLLRPRIKQEPLDKGKMDDPRITSSDYGAYIPRIWGKARLGGNIIWSSGVQHYITTTPTGGGKGMPQAPATRTHTYQTSVAVLVARGEIPQFLRIWADQNLLLNAGPSAGGNFEAELATLSGGASIVDPSAGASGGKSVTNLGNGGKAVFDFSAVTPPTAPPTSDPDEVVLPYTHCEFFYKSNAERTVKITTNVTAQTSYTFPTTAGEWTSKTLELTGHITSLTYENSSAACPDLDLIYIDKYWFITYEGGAWQPQYRVTGIVNESRAYPTDLDDPSGYYNFVPVADGDGTYNMTTPIPNEVIRYYSGTSTQAQDSAMVAWLDNRYGIGEGVLRAPAHRDLAYVVFENRTLKQARVDNFTFEVNAGNPTVNDILGDLLDDVGIGSGDRTLTATNGLTQVGFMEHTQTSIRALIESLERYHGFRIAEIDGKLTTIVDSQASTATINADLIRAHMAGEQMPASDASVLLKEESMRPREVRLSFMNPLLEYHNETIPATLFASTASVEAKEYTFPIIDLPQNARYQAERLLLKEHAEDKAIEFTGMPEMAQYSVGDVITVPIGAENIVMRIERKQMPLPMGPIKFQCMAVNRFVITDVQDDVTNLAPARVNQYAANSFPRNGIVLAIQSEPLNDSERSKMGFYMGVCGRGRGSGENFALYREADTDNYVPDRIVSVPAMMGLAAGVLANHTPITNEDTTNTLDIWFFDDIELETVTQPDLDKLPTLNLIRIGNEWVQFRTATAQTLEENSPYRSKWRISNLWRGRFGTSNAVDKHVEDEYCMAYSRAVFFYETNSADVGEDLRFKAVNGQNVDVAPVTAITNYTPASQYTITNATPSRTMNANDTTIENIADVLATVIDDLNL